MRLTGRSDGEHGHVWNEQQNSIEGVAANGGVWESPLTMDLLQSPHAKMRALVAKSPSALEPYEAFEELVKSKLLTWPTTSADQATGFIMSVWTARAVETGRIKIPRGDLDWIVRTGKACRRRLKGAETVWAVELAAHLMRIVAKT